MWLDCVCIFYLLTFFSFEIKFTLGEMYKSSIYYTMGFDECIPLYNPTVIFSVKLKNNMTIIQKVSCALSQLILTF